MRIRLLVRLGLVGFVAWLMLLSEPCGSPVQAATIVSPVARAFNGEIVELSWRKTANAKPDIFATVAGLARAQVMGQMIDEKTASTLKIQLLANGDSQLAKSQGGGTTAQSQAKWRSIYNDDNKTLTVRTDGTMATVDNPGGNPGGATAQVADPFFFVDAAGEEFDFSFGLFGGPDGRLLQAVGNGMLAEILTTAGSNIPGLETFFTLTMRVSASDPASLFVSFRGNDQLGFSDSVEQMIESDIRSRIVFDPDTLSHSIPGSDFTYANFSVTVPTSQNNVTYFWNTTASAQVVPEPANWILWSLAAAIMIPWIPMRFQRIDACPSGLVGHCPQRCSVGSIAQREATGHELVD